MHNMTKLTDLNHIYDPYKAKHVFPRNYELTILGGTSRKWLRETIRTYSGPVMEVGSYCYDIWHVLVIFLR